MAVVRSPLLHSPDSNLTSAFSPYTDSPSSQAAPFNKRSSTDSTGHLHPFPQRSPQLGSPSDIGDPSPIASSNGTDTTDFDDTGVEEDKESSLRGDERSASNRSSTGIRVMTKDANGDDFRPGSEEEEYPTSVIHAPGTSQPFSNSSTQKSSPIMGRSTPTPSQQSDITVISTQEEVNGRKNNPLSPPPISTSIPPIHDSLKTPRAQTRQEAEALEQERVARMKSKSLEDIPESQDMETDDQDDYIFDTVSGRIQKSNDEVSALRLALSECWTLCNTLAGLSYIHRERAFRYKKKGDGREQAWKSCWKLCQKLYDTWDEDQASQVTPTLNLCREFCQSLFEVRQRENDVADSVLRVSFELNNHLYNTHDRALPEAFRERTLDFYITLCHRLMKQRNRMMEETDTLLRACWSLAEMLFSLRQNRREGKPGDEGLLGSAVQSCWELCDLFREGWTQVRPDRGTPRPSQATFTQAFHQAQQSEKALSVSVLDQDDYDDDVGRQNPETPTTIFEDTQQMSPDEASVPNIVVLGPDAKDRYSQQWSSSASNLSGYSKASGTTTSSTSTIINPSEDPRLTCLRLLIIKAAINLGYTRGEKLSSFVKSISSNSFGTTPWQLKLLENYKKLVASDHTFKHVGPPRRATAPNVARSVQWMVGSGQYLWLNDLFRWVFGFHVEEAEMRPGVDIQS